MEILTLIAIPAVLVWSLVVAKQQSRMDAHLLPTIGLLVVIVGSVFGYEFFHLSGGPIPITLDRILLGGLLALFGLFWFRGSEHIRQVNKADLVILALMGVVAASAMTHDWRFMENMPASRLLFFYFIPLVLYLVVSTARLNVADLKWISLLLAGFGFYLAVTAIAETRELASWVFPRYIMDASELEFLGRGRGPFLNPVSNGVFQCACLCAMWMWWPDSSRRGKVILIFLTAVMAAGIFCTLTRSVWVGFVATAGLVIWYPATRQTKGLLIILATIVMIVSLPLVGERIFSFKRDKAVSQAEMEMSAQLRPLFAMVAWEMFQDRPVFGCGFGQYARAKYPYLQDPYSGRPLSSTKYFMQHNVVLAYLTETGLVGVLVLLTMLIMMARTSWSIWQDDSLEHWARRYGMFMLVLLINFFINGMFHDVSIIPMQNMLLFFGFGLVNNIASHRLEFAVGRQSEIDLDALPAIVRPRRLRAEDLAGEQAVPTA